MCVFLFPVSGTFRRTITTTKVESHTLRQRIDSYFTAHTAFIFPVDIKTAVGSAKTCFGGDTTLVNSTTPRIVPYRRHGLPYRWKKSVYFPSTAKPHSTDEVTFSLGVARMCAHGVAVQVVNHCVIKTHAWTFDSGALLCYGRFMQRLPCGRHGCIHAHMGKCFIPIPKKPASKPVANHRALKCGQKKASHALTSLKPILHALDLHACSRAPGAK